MTIPMGAGKAIMAPEPGLTPKQLIARAAALRPLLVDEQAETERRTRPSDEIHRACVEAGIYRLYQPRRYGGYEFDALTYMRVLIELGRGDMSAAWCIALAAAHALQVASWWPQRAQDEIFGDGDFRCAAVAAPVVADLIGDEWELSGRVAYCSGIPFSTHFMGQALITEADGRPHERMLLFVAPRSEFEILDDWGGLMGLKGSGSNTVVFDHNRVPAYWVIEDALMVDFNVDEPPPGVALHGNPMYGGRAMGCFTLTLTALAVGAAYHALDEYEAMLRTKMTQLPPYLPRIGDQTYQRWFGSALVKIATAEAALINATEQHMEACQRAAEEHVPYTYGDDMRIASIAREAIIQLWNVVQGEIFHTAGSSAGVSGSSFERIYRDMAMLGSHRNTALREWGFGELARAYLGLPRLGVGNVQTPHPGRAALDRL